MSANKYFNRIKKYVVENGNYMPCDDIIISQAAEILMAIDEAKYELEKNGHIQEFKTGAKQISPELNSWRGLLQDFAKYSDMLGLSPKARKRLSVESQPEQKNENPFQLRKIK